MGEEVSQDQMNEFFDMLIGSSLPEGVLMTDPPKLSPEHAHSVIWYLQEYLSVLPDQFELCDECDYIYDTSSEGHTIDELHEDDRWYEQCGLSPEDVKPHIGKHFCDSDCEFQYLTTMARNPQGAAEIPDEEVTNG